MACPVDWPEPVTRVQSIADSGAPEIPQRYIKPPSERPSSTSARNAAAGNIPVVDLSGGDGDVAEAVSAACRDWGFFQVVNHGVSPALMRRARAAWRGFFHQPMEVKQRYSNSPTTYEGYGSRLGVEKGAILDWGDYFFLHFRPPSLLCRDKWPSLPTELRATMDEYSESVLGLCRRLMTALSVGLRLDSHRLWEAFGGEDAGACMRVNFYPRCPQPELTLGLSSHSDPGGMTVLLVDDRVQGLQVKKDGDWVFIEPEPDAFVVNVGDQIQVLTNAAYPSVEHRVIVNANDERLSMAFFFNPKSNLPMAPFPELVTSDRPALYSPMSFDEYRLYIRQKGPRGKAQVESLKGDR